MELLTRAGVKKKRAIMLCMMALLALHQKK